MKSIILKRALPVFIACLLTAGLATLNYTSAAVPGVNIRVSVDSSGNQATGTTSEQSSISHDGRYVAFESNASNLVPNDTNNPRDIFVRDTASGTTSRVNVSSSGAQASGGASNSARISHNGRYVTFSSLASNLVTGDTNGTQDIFIHDLNTGTTQLISVDATGGPANAASGWSDISADGRFVVFSSYASDLVSNGNSNQNIYVRDLEKSTTTLLSKDPSGNPGNSDSNVPSISCDGGIIAFQSWATSLVSGDTNSKPDIIIVNRAGGDTVYNVTSAGDGDSLNPDVSCDGNYIAFDSAATNLVSGDTNLKQDVFRYSRVDLSTALISKSTGGTLGNDFSARPAISGDGRYISYDSGATNLVSGDTNGQGDIFITDVLTGTTERLSVDSSLAQANGSSGIPDISTNAKYVSYVSSASNLVSSDTNGVMDAFRSETGY